MKRVKVLKFQRNDKLSKKNFKPIINKMLVRLKNQRKSQNLLHPSIVHVYFTNNLNKTISTKTSKKTNLFIPKKNKNLL